MGDDTPADGFAVLPLRGVTLFPGATLEVEIGPEEAVTLRKAFSKGDSIAAVTSSPASDGRLFTVGTLARIRAFDPLPDGGARLELEGTARFRVNRVRSQAGSKAASVTAITELPFLTVDEPLRSELARLRTLFRELSDSVGGERAALLARLDSSADPGVVADLIASELDSLAASLRLFGDQRITIPVEEKQAVLEAIDIAARLSLVTKQLLRLRQIANLSARVEAAQAERRPQTRGEHLQLVAKVIEQALKENPEDPRYLSAFLAGLRKEAGKLGN